MNGIIKGLLPRIRLNAVEVLSKQVIPDTVDYCWCFRKIDGSIYCAWDIALSNVEQVRMN